MSLKERQDKLREAWFKKWDEVEKVDKKKSWYCGRKWRLAIENAVNPNKPSRYGVSDLIMRHVSKTGIADLGNTHNS